MGSFRAGTLMPKARVRKSKAISYVVRFGIAGVALYLVFRGEDPGQIGHVLLGLNRWILVAAIGIYLLSQFIFVARWSLLLRVQSIRIGFWPAVRLHFLGLFYNNCLPGAIGGDLPRAWYATKHTDKKLEAALSVFVDRIVGLTGMLIMAFGCYWFVPEQSRQEGFNFSFELGFLRLLSQYKWVLIGIGAALLLSLALTASHSRGRALLRRGIEGAWRRGVVVVNKVRQSIRIYCHKWPAIVFALLLTFVLQTMHVVAMWLIGREIGIAAPAKYYFIFFPLSFLLGALPISVGGLGIMEGWLKVMFMRVGTISSQDAVALALCQRLILVLASLPGALIHLIGAHLPKEFFVDEQNPAP